MLLIKKTKTGFRVQVIAANSEILLTSEVLKTKQSCYKNIKATAKNFSSPGLVSVVVNDCGVNMYLDLKTGKVQKL